MADDREFQVGVSFLVVPDGIRDAESGKVCRLSISVTPNVDPGAVSVDLRRWPEEIAQLYRTLKVVVGRIAGASPNQRTIEEPLTVLPPTMSDAHTRFATDAGKLWRRIFAPDEDLWGFRMLSAALHKGRTEAPKPATRAAEVLHGTYHSADLGRAVRALYGSASATQMLQRLGAMAADGSGSAVPSGDLNTAVPSAEWWPAFRSEWFPSIPPLNPDGVYAKVSGHAGTGALAGVDVRSQVRREMAAAAALSTALPVVFAGQQDIPRASRLNADDGHGDSPVGGPFDAGREYVDEEAEVLTRIAERHGLESLDEVVPNRRTRVVASHLAGCGADACEKVGDVRFWATGGGPLFSSDRRHILRKELARFEESWHLGSQTSAANAPAEEVSDQNEPAGRKLTAVLALPTLAKFLGLIVDVEIPLEHIRAAAAAGADNRCYGAIAVDVEHSRPADRVWTAFVLQPSYFGPCSKTETIGRRIDPQQLVKDGIVDLTIALAPDTPRFELMTLDVTAAVMSLRQRAIDITEGQSLPDPGSARLPELRTRGIALIDKNRETDTQTSSSPTRPQGLQIRDAEDLLLGYRIDAAVAERGLQWQNQKRWRSLVCRQLTYGHQDIPEGFVTHPDVDRVRSRDDGHVRPMTGVYREKTKTQSDTHQELFAWVGESLAVPSLPSATDMMLGGRVRQDPDGRLLYPDPCEDLAINLEVDLPERAGPVDRRPPPLRHGRGYVFGARAYFVNGCGLTHDQAAARYCGNPAIVLGAKPGVPLVYRRIEEIQAPDVLLPWDDRIVTSPATKDGGSAGSDRRLRDAPGETVDDLVVRSGQPNVTARRFLMPARATFDFAEQSTALDEIEMPRQENGPLRGAFERVAKIALDKKLGVYPTAKNGSYDTPTRRKEQEESQRTSHTSPRMPPNKNDKKEQSRGSVLVLDRKASQTEEPFYPDLLARGIRARFVKGGAPPKGFSTLDQSVDFWPARKWMDARPILLELRAATATDNARGRFFVDEHEVRPKNGRSSIKLPRLTVYLAPAERLDLELWADVDPQVLREGHTAFEQALDLLRMRSTAGRLPVGSGFDLTAGQKSVFDQLLSGLTSADAAAEADIVRRILAHAPIEQVTTRRIVHLVHAVEQPLRPPSFVRDAGGRAKLRAVVLKVASGAGQTSTELTTWDAFVMKQQADPRTTDPMTWESQRDGTTSFIVGSLNADRLSTGQLRCEAEWKEYSAISLRRDQDRKRWILDAQTMVARFPSIDDVKSDEDFLGREVDLLRDDEDCLRGMFHSFPDGRARRVRVVAVGTSRFTGLFHSDEAIAAQGAGRFELPSAPSFAKSDVELLVPATARPAPPDVDRVLPVFHWKTWSEAHGTEIHWRRESSLRVYLKPTWHSSGEDEKLVVLFAVNKDLAPTFVDECALEAETGRFKDYITRWGADPTHPSGFSEHLISPDQLSNPRSPDLPERVTARLPLVEPKPDQETGSVEELQPALGLIYTPALEMDDESGQWSADEDGPWSCDIKIDPRSVYFPFVQLGLARFQANSVSDLEFSRPIAVWAQIPPHRQGKVIRGPGRSIVVELRGVFFDLAAGDSSAGETERPQVTAQVLVSTESDRMPRDHDGERAWRRLVEHGQVKKVIVPLTTETGNGTKERYWHAPLMLPPKQAGVTYGLLIEEVERIPADVLTPPAPGAFVTPANFTEKMADRGPLFSHIVELGE